MTQCVFNSFRFEKCYKETSNFVYVRLVALAVVATWDSSFRIAALGVQFLSQKWFKCSSWSYKNPFMSIVVFIY